MAESAERSPPLNPANSDDRPPSRLLAPSDVGYRPGRGTYPLWFGGLAATLSASIIYPLELAKIRLQLVPGTAASSASATTAAAAGSGSSALGQGSSGSARGGAAPDGTGVASLGKAGHPSRLRLSDVVLTELRTSGQSHDFASNVFWEPLSRVFIMM
jgi:hypothetical protein